MVYRDYTYEEKNIYINDKLIYFLLNINVKYSGFKLGRIFIIFLIKEYN